MLTSGSEDYGMMSVLKIINICMITVNEDGLIALIHESEEDINTYVSLDANNPNFFKVQWADGQFPSVSHGCGAISTCEVKGTTCHCDVNVKKKRVFKREPASASVILSRLSMGAPDPYSFDEGTYENLMTDKGFTVHHKVGKGNGKNKNTSHTIFGVYQNGTWKYFRNAISTVRISGEADEAVYSFRNPPHFLHLMDPNTRDAIHETEAVLDHFLYHPNTPTFVAVRLIQRFGTSNPSPGYISRVSLAFKEGVYATKNGIEFGEGRWGDLAATTAAIVLDEEVRTVVVDSESNVYGTHSSFRKELPY